MCATHQKCVTINCSPTLRTYVKHLSQLHTDSVWFKKMLVIKERHVKGAVSVVWICSDYCKHCYDYYTVQLLKPLSTHRMLNIITSATKQYTTRRKLTHI